MIGKKISQLDSLTAETLALDDVIVAVDVNDNSTPSGQTKKISILEITRNILVNAPQISSSLITSSFTFLQSTETGSMFVGTSSLAFQAISSSFSLSSSYSETSTLAENSISASYSVSSSYSLSSSISDMSFTSSYSISSSISDLSLTSSYSLISDTSNFSNTSRLAATASYVENVTVVDLSFTSSYLTKQSFDIATSSLLPLNDTLIINNLIVTGSGIAISGSNGIKSIFVFSNIPTINETGSLVVGTLYKDNDGFIKIV